MDIKEALEESERIWNSVEYRDSLAKQLAVLGKVFGDISLIIRDHSEGVEIDIENYCRKLANMALSSLRFIKQYSITHDGLSNALEASLKSQREHAKKINYLL